MLRASNELAFALAEKYKPLYDGEDIFKPCLHKITKRIGDKSIERKVNNIALSKQTIIQHTEELSHDASFFSLALDKFADICDVVQLNILIRGSDDNLNILEELIGLESLHKKTQRVRHI